MAAPKGSLWVRAQRGLLSLLLLTMTLAGGSGTASAEAFDSVLGDTASCHQACQLTYPLHTYPKVGPVRTGPRPFAVRPLLRCLRVGCGTPAVECTPQCGLPQGRLRSPSASLSAPGSCCNYGKLGIGEGTARVPPGAGAGRGGALCTERSGSGSPGSTSQQPGPAVGPRLGRRPAGLSPPC